MCATQTSPSEAVRVCQWLSSTIGPPAAGAVCAAGFDSAGFDSAGFAASAGAAVGWAAAAGAAGLLSAGFDSAGLLSVAGAGDEQADRIPSPVTPPRSFSTSRRLRCAAISPSPRPPALQRADVSHRLASSVLRALPSPPFLTGCNQLAQETGCLRHGQIGCARAPPTLRRRDDALTN